MSTVSSTHSAPPDAPLPPRIPPLANGDRLKLDEYWRRYLAMPGVKNAEVVEGIVYMPSPVSAEGHSEPHSRVSTWLGVYSSQCKGVIAGDNATLRLDEDNAPQPDAYLRKVPGQSRVVNGYLEGAPEFIAEISGSTASFDLHGKLRTYRRHRVREYLVHRTWDGEVDWFALQGEELMRQAPDEKGVYRSREFPGLWLDSAALLAGDLTRLLQTLQAGIAAEGPK